jgi:hypothetical protein
MGMMKIDIDKLTFRNVRFLLALEKPYELRAGFKGLNLRKDCPGCSEMNDNHSCYGCWVYTQFDDRNRLKLNRQQEYRGLSHNILWDIKRGEKKPGEWTMIRTTQEADRYLRQFTGFW